MMYLFVAILLLVGTIFEIVIRKSIKQYFSIVSFVLLILLCLRFGQGTDYYAYFLQYKYIDIGLPFFKIINYVMHGEPGWRVLMWLFKRLGASFEIFIVILSVVMMYSSIRAIRKFSPYKVTSLFLLYPTYVMTYFFSALRQGLVLSLFLGFGIEFLFSKEYKKYYLLIVVLTFFHSSALFLLCIPVVLVLFQKGRYKLVYGTCVIMALMGYTGIINVVERLIPNVSRYLDLSVSIPAILIRIIFFSLIYLMHIKLRYFENDIEKRMYHLYVFGICVFMALSFSANLSQRVTVPIKAIEILLIPIQLKMILNLKRVPDKKGVIKRNKGLTLSKKNLVLICITMVLMIPSIEYVKNINSYILQGNYYDSINIFNYPYISLWEKNEVHLYLSHFDEQIE